MSSNAAVSTNAAVDNKRRGRRSTAGHEQCGADGADGMTLKESQSARRWHLPQIPFRAIATGSCCHNTSDRHEQNMPGQHDPSTSAFSYYLRRRAASARYPGRHSGNSTMHYSGVHLTGWRERACSPKGGPSMRRRLSSVLWNKCTSDMSSMLARSETSCSSVSDASLMDAL